MNAKKLVTSAIMTLLVMTSASAFAQISKSELNIGGIYYGQPFSEVVSRFGEPMQRVSTYPKGFAAIYRNNFNVTSSENRNGIVVGVSVNTGSTLRARTGVGLGSSVSDIKASYGEPDKIESISGDSTLYTYLTDNSEGSLVFGVSNSTGVVNSFGFSGSVADSRGSQPKPQQKPSQPQQPITPTSTLPNKVTEMPAAELNIGWVEPGQTMDNVEKVYGKPSKVDDEGFFQTYNYNDKFIVKGKMNKGYKVMSVASYEKGMKTPSGFMVGDSYSAVVKKFGAVKGIKFKGEGVEAKLKGCTDYTYFSGDKQMVFIVDKNDVIRAIRVEELDEQKFIEAKRKK